MLGPPYFITFDFDFHPEGSTFVKLSDINENTTFRAIFAFLTCPLISPLHKLEHCLVSGTSTTGKHLYICTFINIYTRQRPLETSCNVSMLQASLNAPHPSWIGPMALQQAALAPATRQESVTTCSNMFKLLNFYELGVVSREPVALYLCVSASVCFSQKTSHLSSPHVQLHIAYICILYRSIYFETFRAPLLVPAGGGGLCTGGHIPSMHLKFDKTSTKQVS